LEVKGLVASPCPLQRRGFLKKREVKVLSFGEDLGEATGKRLKTYEIFKIS
jgi:hypothetical protein